MHTSDKERQFPISETFVSVQGEGEHVGRVMFFVRLAGCSVGKRFPKARYEPKMDPIEGAHEIPGLPIYTEECHTVDGRSFQCDTDFRRKEMLTIEQIMQRLPEDVMHICVTGGEPCNYDLRPFWQYQHPKGLGFRSLYVETSGTVSLEKAFPGIMGKSGMWAEVWITCSPKLGALPEVMRRANEIKLLVDENFDEAKLPKEVLEHDNVFIQPVNGEHTISRENTQRVMDLLGSHPNWRPSFQLHKVVQMITGDRIR